jgi:serine protease AprX
MIRSLFALIVALSTLPTLAWSPAFAPAPAPEPPPKVARAAWEQAIQPDGTDVIVMAAGYPDLSPARALATKEARTRFVFEALLRFAERAQAGLRRGLDERGVAYHVLWITNSIAIPRADRALLQWLGNRVDVARVDVDAKSRGIETVENAGRRVTNDGRRAGTGNWQSLQRDQGESTIGNPQSVEWGVARVNAPAVWAQGYLGQGIVVADLDTGVQWDHPALVAHYRGTSSISGTVTHDYNWLDPVGETPDYPSDDNGHGTHTTGTIVGDDGIGAQIGVAPRAEWIACRNMSYGTGSVSRYIECFQFAMAPTRTDGSAPDPALAADITSNSWSCWGEGPWNEDGCLEPTALLSVTQAMDYAGVMVIAAAGNEGSGCGSVSHSPGAYDETFTIGATDDTNTAAGFSSRGPSAFSGHIKPDVVAPGVSVYSSVPGGGYGVKSGTSMATPHVAGVVALLWSAAPWLRGQVEESAAILRHTAQPLTSDELCGGVSGSSVPNNTYGYGLIDAQAAVSEAHALIVNSFVAPESPVAAPITFTLAVTNESGTTRTDVTLYASLPASSTFVGAEPQGVVNGSAVTWALGNLAPHANRQVMLVVKADGAGVITNADYGVRYAGLTMTRTEAGKPASTYAVPVAIEADAPVVISAQLPITYGLTVANASAVTYTNAVVTAVLPALATLMAVSPTGQVNGQVVTWALDDFVAGTEWNAMVVVSASVPGLLTGGSYRVVYDPAAPALVGALPDVLAYSVLKLYPAFWR